MSADVDGHPAVVSGGREEEEATGGRKLNPNLLRSNEFEAFMVDRQRQLVSLIEEATVSRYLSMT
ncbi:hypothetical protein [Rhodococcus sp. NPDC057529]|uniref:hypothetical protein n=1 Tax=Rhodococcus sp. NPDC057529 TaxID=3346158 RepID=UPI003670B9CF